MTTKSKNAEAAKIVATLTKWNAEQGIIKARLANDYVFIGDAEIKRKKVKDLVVGDQLEGTKGVIIEGPFDQVRTPKGKTNIVVKYPSGDTRQYIWNKNTEVRIA